MGNSSSSSRHGVVTGSFQPYPPPQQQQHQHAPAGQQPYNPYPQTRVYPPPPTGYQGGYNNGQYYTGQYQAHQGGFYNPPYQPGAHQPPYAAGQFGQPPQQRQAPPGAGGAAAAAAARGPPPPAQEVHAAQTIRNQVNLKKSSIKVQPVPNNPGQFSLTFSLDATAPCRVSVFLNSRDDVARNKIISQQAPLLVAKCDKGIDHKFPLPGSPPMLLSAAWLKDWKTMPEDQFPVVIRLEALTDEGRAEGKSLDSVEPGGELPQWLQSQTTYARVQQHEDGSWAPAAILQKLFVRGMVWELQEIFGMEQGRPAEAVDGIDDIDGNECVICMSEPRDTTVLPCRHMCMCHTCANELKTQTNKCPICRNVMSSLMHIKMANQAPAGTAAAAAATRAAAAARAAAPATGAAVS